MAGVVAACVLALGFQEQDETIRSLVRKLRRDDIEAVDRAAAELVRRGPAALPELRRIRDLRSGDVALRLAEIIGKIERDDRLRRVIGTEPVVTLRARDLPLVEVLDRLSRQSGVPVEPEEIPEDLRVSLDVADRPLWTALDALCREHGGLRVVYAPDRVVVRPGSPRPLPLTVRRGFGFVVDGFLWTRSFHQGGSNAYFNLQAGVLLPPGADPLAANLTLEVFEDDQGTSLLRGRGGLWQWSSAWKQASPEGTSRLLLPLNQHSNILPDDEATKVARLKGRVLLTFALRMDRQLSVPDPGEGKQAKAENRTLLIRRFRRSGRSVVAELEVKSRWPGGVDLWQLQRRRAIGWRIVLRDGAGRDHAGDIERQGSSSTSGPAGRSETRTLTASFELPEGAEPASLDLVQPADFEEVELPFDFSGLPLE